MALSVLSGLLLVAASEPFGAGVLGWVALVPLVLALGRARSARRAAGYGFVTGFVFFGAHLYWIFLFGWMAWTALAAVLAVYIALAAVAMRAVRPLPLGPAFVAAAWAGMDLLRGTVPWGGYAWGSLGTTQAGIPGLSWLAGSIGVYGLSFVCAFAAVVVATLIERRALPTRAIAVVGAAVVAFGAADFIGARDPEGRRVEIAVVQGSVPRPAVFDQEERVLANHVRLTRTLAADPPDVVVWPESAAGHLPEADVRPVIEQSARRVGRPMLVGRTEDDPVRATFENLVEHVDADGRVVASYAKRHAVPFGEVVPLGFLRGFVTTLEQVPYDMVPGRRSVPFDVGGVKIATPICFESVFPRDVRAFVRSGAEIVVVSTNDASFERSAASRQHLAHARLRALETRRYVVQAAISGVSAVVAPDGRVSGRTRLFEPTVMRVDVRARSGQTFYVRIGDAFTVAWALGAAVAFLARRRPSAIHDAEPRPAVPVS